MIVVQQLSQDIPTPARVYKLIDYDIFDSSYINKPLRRLANTIFFLKLNPNILHQNYRLLSCVAL
jgi:hypothetical protein